MRTSPNFLAFQSDDYATKSVPVTRCQFGCGPRVATKGYGRANPYMTGWKNTGSKMAATESPVFFQGRNSAEKGGEVAACVVDAIALQYELERAADRQCCGLQSRGNDE